MKFHLAVALLLAATIVLAHAQTDENAEWEKYKNKFGKAFGDKVKEGKRRANWKKNKAKNDEHNKLYAAGRVTFTKGENHFSDLSDEEFKSLLTEKDVPQGFVHEAPVMQTLRQSNNLPASLNWTQNFCMPPVKDQGPCGSCWAFAATGVLEFLRCNATKQLVIMSEQNLVDCSDGIYYNGGCNGGLAIQAWSYVIRNGLATNAAYPYTAITGTCKYTYDPARYNLNQTTWNFVTTTNDEDSIAVALNQYGPIAVSVDATNLSSYKSGVFVDTTCSQTSTNHAMIVVGYGTDAATNLPFWIIRNSWSTRWGEGGYIRFLRGKNQCAITKRPVFAVVNAVQPKI